MRKLSTNQLIKELDKYKFKQLHVHHTWKPEHKNFKGNNHIAMQKSMKNYHVNTNGWNDIGQHVSLFPDGVFVTGRPFNKTPASIKGWNTGAFCVETIGNFDIGHDKLQGKQKDGLLKLVRYFVNKYGEQSIKFHREGPGVAKTCPGTSLNKQTMIKEAMQTHNKQEGGNKVTKPKIDISVPSPWAKKAWDQAKKDGVTDGTRPKETATREEIVVMMYRLHKQDNIK